MSKDDKTQEVAVSKQGSTPPAALQGWNPFETLHREVDRLFDDFGRDLWRIPFPRPFFGSERSRQGREAVLAAPAVDVIEKSDHYEIAAELPGMDEKDIAVKLTDGSLAITGEKHGEKEEKGKNYHLHERHFGSFERRFRLPDGVDAGKIEARFQKGVLTVTLPKKPEAQTPEKKIEVKTA